MASALASGPVTLTLASRSFEASFHGLGLGPGLGLGMALTLASRSFEASFHGLGLGLGTYGIDLGLEEPRSQLLWPRPWPWPWPRDL